MRHRLWAALLALAVTSRCARPAEPFGEPDPQDSTVLDAGVLLDGGEPLDAGEDGGAGAQDAGNDCQRVGLTATRVATAFADDDFALVLPARSLSRTRWSEAGNEALVLEVSGAHGLIGHLVLHQGAADFLYSMHLGRLSAEEEITVKVSSLSAQQATQEACIGEAQLSSASELGASGEGLVHAPVYKWPKAKRFDDLPLLLGWSSGGKSYSTVFTNENGGTPVQCGGGAGGLAAEIARWGRASDIETSFRYGGTAPSWNRCKAPAETEIVAWRFEGEHPIVYYGNGHNNLFESRGGYGAVCGTAPDQRSDGDLEGWNVNNPGNEPAQDTDYAITLRPLPVALDSLGYRDSYGRREGLIDTYAPWLYRLTDSELRREGKIDQSHTFGLDQYLYVDVHAADVDGEGDGICTFRTNGGFKLIAHAGSTAFAGPRTTASYFGASSAGTAWKRLAIPLGASYDARELTRFTFDAYDADGIFLLDIADAFIPTAVGDNGATLRYVRQGIKALNVYVDDDSSGCVSGTNSGGPGGKAYPCEVNLYDFAAK